MKEKKTLENIGRMMPQAVDAERAVIGACLIEQDAYSRISELLRPGSFYDTKHQIIFEAIKHLNDAGEPVDSLTVTERLLKNGELEKAGGASYMGELSTSMLSSAHIELHARIVAEKAQRRHIIEHARDITNEAFDEACDVGEIITRSQDELARISGYSAQRYSTLHDTLEEVVSIAEANASGERPHTGTMTGFSYLDESGGLQPGNLIVIAAESSVGKTSFCLSLTETALLAGRKVCFYTLEMGKRELTARLLSPYVGVTGNRILTGRLAADELEKVKSAKCALDRHDLIFDDKATSNVDDIISSVRSLSTRGKIDGVCVDYLQILSVNQSRMDQEAQLASMARRLKNLAVELNIWIVALSQFNRNGGERSVDRLRGSGQIVEAADVVLTIDRLDRPEEKRTEYPKPFNNIDIRGTALIRIAKGRSIGTGAFIAGFDTSTQKFFDVPEDRLPRRKPNNIVSTNEEDPF